MGRSIGKIDKGIPMPIMPTENVGIMSGAIRKKSGGRRDKRGSRRGGSMTQVTMKDPETGRMYGGLVKDGQPQFKKPDFVSDENFNKSFPKPGAASLGRGTPPPGFKYNEIDQLVPIDTPSIGQNPRPFKIPPDFVCPDPNMHILMSNESQKKAGDLVVGDLVKTYHEENFKLGEYEVEHVDIVNDVEKIKLIFDESTIVCSLSHKLYVGDSWKKAKDMVIGDEVSGKKLVAIEDFENGDVVRITIKDAHTYICEGLLSHNKSPRPPVRPGDKPPDVGPFPDPTLGGPPEREVPIPKERPIRIEDGQKNFFETMFERAENKKQMRDIEKGERRDRQESRREEARMRDSERGGDRKREDRGGRRMRDDDRGGRRRRRRRDFTRKRSRMEGRRSREERGAFRDKYVSTLKR